MNLASKLRQRAEQGRPVRVGLIGAGKFGTMFVAQARTTPGMHMMAVADLSAANARRAMGIAGYPDEAVTDRFDVAFATGATAVGDDPEALIAAPGMEVVIDATGDPAAGIRHALLAAEHGCHIVMVNVEADVLAGPHLAEVFRKAGLVYSLAYGDQPALICELVDWAEASGFRVVCAGKGTKYLPAYHHSTPDTVFDHWGFTAEQLAVGDKNPQMYNSFLDGTKSAIEMAAVSNATGLKAPRGGLFFPPAGADDLPFVLRPRDHGGCLDESGTVEVVSSLERDGRTVFRHLRAGVFVVFEAGDQSASGAYAQRTMAEYFVSADPSGRYGALYRPAHLAGLELGISVASAAVRGEATGSARAFDADVVAIAKRDLRPGDMLDGEGGYTVWGRLARAEDSLAEGALPIGLAHKVKVTRPVAAGATVTRADVELAESPALAVRNRMEDEARQRLGGRLAAAQ
jgi:predicted homoserine dehydrogenase-like protein